jgi:hypothetical protein
MLLAAALTGIWSLYAAAREGMWSLQAAAIFAGIWSLNAAAFVGVWFHTRPPSFGYYWSLAAADYGYLNTSTLRRAFAQDKHPVREALCGHLNDNLKHPVWVAACGHVKYWAHAQYISNTLILLAIHGRFQNTTFHRYILFFAAAPVCISGILFFFSALKQIICPNYVPLIHSIASPAGFCSRELIGGGPRFQFDSPIVSERIVDSNNLVALSACTYFFEYQCLPGDVRSSLDKNTHCGGGPLFRTIMLAGFPTPLGRVRPAVR